MRGIVVGVIIVIILLIVWASVATNLLVINLGKSDDTIAYNNQTINDLKRLIDSGEVDNSKLHRVLDQLESDFVSQATALNTCRNIKTQCGTDLSACVTGKSVCDQTLTQCTTEKGTCTGNLTQCTTEKGTCTGNLTQCTTEKGRCVSDKTTCDTNLVDANVKIVALQGQITTLGETPTYSTTTTSSNTGQTIGITVAVTIVVVGAVWFLMRRSSAKTTPAVGMRPPAKYRTRTSFVPNSLIRGTRRLFSSSMSGAPRSHIEQASDPPYVHPVPANDHTTAPDQVSYRDESEFNAPEYGNLVPAELAVELGRERRALNSQRIGFDIANAAAKLNRINDDSLRI